MNEARGFGGWDRGGQHPFHHAHHHAASPIVGLKLAIPLKSKVSGVRCSAGQIGDFSREVEVVSRHHGNAFFDGLLHGPVFVEQRHDVDGHLALEDPCFGKVVTLSAVEVTERYIDFTG